MSKITVFADSIRVRGSHTYSRNWIRRDDSRLEGLRHAHFNQRFSGQRKCPLLGHVSSVFSEFSVQTLRCHAKTKNRLYRCQLT